MATTIDEIAQHLDNRDWTYTIDEAKSRVIAGVKGDNVEKFAIVIQLLRDGKSLQLYTPELLKVKNHVYKGVLFQSLLSLMWDCNSVRFEYDPRDGELRATIDLLLEDAPLTVQQFSSALSLLVEAVDSLMMPRMQSILATGNDPGCKVLANKILDGMSPEMIRLLEEAIRDRANPSS
ncbi:MAG: YbjN domain-containing protein [Cyanobacteria bacterium J06600_6]